MNLQNSSRGDCIASIIPFDKMDITALQAEAKERRAVVKINELEEILHSEKKLLM